MKELLDTIKRMAIEHERRIEKLEEEVKNLKRIKYPQDSTHGLPIKTRTDFIKEFKINEND